MKRTISIVSKSPWFWLIAAGYMLRIMVMPITGQHDVMFMPWMTHYINQGHFNLYAFLYEKFGDIVMHSPGVWAPYPYGFYLFTAGWLEFLEKMGLVDLTAWDSVWQVSHPARYVFLFKAAYLPFDLVIGYILYKTSGRVGLALWAWSPTVIYTAFMMGQNDIYATTFAVAGTYAASKATQITPQSQVPSVRVLDKWAILSCLLLGVGGSFKIYPLFLLAPLVLMIEKRWWQRFSLFFLGCFIFGVSLLPFLTTPAFVKGVLLNPEGTQIFREIQLFGMSVSPFLLGYVILVGHLIINPANHLPWMVWFASLVSIALVFLWVPVPFYWLIWITPLLIGAISRFPKLIFAWGLVQLTFALMMVNQHRELGVALPIHLAPIFNVPNLPTALAVAHPDLYRIFITILPIVNVFLVTALLMTIWFSARVLTQVHQEKFVAFDLKPQWWIGVALPTTIMLLMLGANLFFSRDFVSHTNRYNWQNHTLTVNDYVLQELGLEQKEMTGVRLRFVDADPLAVLKVCVYQNNDMNQEPLNCASRSIAEQVENKALYFVFDKAIVFEDNETPTVKIQTENNNTSMVILPYTTLTENSLKFNEITLNGSLDISALSSFNITEAFNILVVENILKDAWLLGAIAIITALVVVFLGVLLGKSYHGHAAN
ncbi:hypothetical protein EYB53_019245 [Candidatus Chloroploca sp. M-50]|uniref:Glycosyltransferase RgtA/B/C/D-like domain-containing protein n=1 Tax=Candidatus Chloroploca mongolica TaxID=2528176 RepID=A0ABS4DEJ4_9CHLR|nr:hypothetical protein [Candidatus Chloroploca mongolica]MBP1467860.1 hypothetical protein [Candidatus Chloroploca mongolica]